VQKEDEKLKTEYIKMKYERDETEWKYFDAPNEVLGHKNSTQPSVVVESFSFTTDD